MRLFFSLLSFLFISQFLVANENVSPIVLNEPELVSHVDSNAWSILSKREIQLIPILPQWSSKVPSSYSEGMIRDIVFYERQSDGSELPCKYIEYYPSGQIKQEADLLPKDVFPFVQHGLTVSYFENGSIQGIAQYGEGRIFGLCEFYSPNGTKIASKNYVNGKLEGVSEYFDENETKVKIENFKNGLLHGQRVEYYPSGKKKCESCYKNGLLCGARILFNEDGTRKSNSHFFNGLLHNDGDKPSFISFYPNGAIFETKRAVLGKLEGPHIQFDENANLRYEVQYSNGLKDGIEQFRDAKGNVIGRGQFKKGVPCGEHYKKHANGKIAYSAKYTEIGTLLEPIRLYTEEGDLFREYMLGDGKLNGPFREWHPNKRVKKEFCYKSGKFDGDQKEYFSNGTLAVFAQFIDGVRNGDHKEWSQDGSLRFECTFVADQVNGERKKWMGKDKPELYATYDHGIKLSEKIWHGNGKLKKEYVTQGINFPVKLSKWNPNGIQLKEVIWQDGMLLSEIHRFHNGNVRSKTSYKQGKKDGIFEEFYENGTRSQLITYSDGLKNGPFKVWFENGQIYQEGNFVGGKPEGLHVTCFANSQTSHEKKPAIESERNYKNGLSNGEQKRYYPNGKIQAVFVYSNGVLDGKKKLWNQNGECIFEANYKGGKIDGLLCKKFSDGSELKQQFKENLPCGQYLFYYPESSVFGKIKAIEATFIDGKIEGEVCEYNEAGTKITSTFFKNGKRNGTCAYFDEQGKLILTGEFKDGLQDGQVCQYFPNGALYRKSQFKNGIQEGEELCYFEDGTTSMRNLYKSGKLQGLCQQWNQQGVLIFEGEYDEGKKNGKFHKYYDTGIVRLKQHFKNDTLISKKAYDEGGKAIK